MVFYVFLSNPGWGTAPRRPCRPSCGRRGVGRPPRRSTPLSRRENHAVAVKTSSSPPPPNPTTGVLTRGVQTPPPPHPCAPGKGGGSRGRGFRGFQSSVGLLCIDIPQFVTAVCRMSTQEVQLPASRNGDERCVVGFAGPHSPPSTPSSPVAHRDGPRRLILGAALYTHIAGGRATESHRGREGGGGKVAEVLAD